MKQTKTNNESDTKELNWVPRRYGEKYTSADSDKHGISFEGQVSRTKQSEAESCDINNIMRRYEETGLLPENLKLPEFGDFSSSKDLQESIHAVRDAREQFNALPPRIRAFFENDPVKMLAFLEQPGNAEKYEELFRGKEEVLKTQGEAPKAQSAAPKTKSKPPKEDDQE